MDITLRREMLAAASRAVQLLGDSGRAAAAAFLRSQQNPDGGFRGRGEASDLYYTLFAAEGLIALGEPPDPMPLRRYLASFGDGNGLDLVHLACLARCWAALGGLPPDTRTILARRIQAHRSADGGFSPTPGAQHGTAYGCFLALGALQDLGAAADTDPNAIGRCLAALKRGDGGYANEPALKASTTPATAAAITIARHLTGAADKEAVGFLLAQAAPGGGFVATPFAPFPDLLSTATALHALAGLAALPPAVGRDTAKFVMALQEKSGGFRGVELDEAPDAEYTFYALLALGHLAGSAP